MGGDQLQQIIMEGQFLNLHIKIINNNTCYINILNTVYYKILQFSYQL